MKAIVKPKHIEVLEVLKVDKNKLPYTLIDTEELKQELLIEDNQIILREKSNELNDKYKSTMYIDIYLNDGDLLVKLDKGYTKPLIELLEIDSKLEKAIELINSK